MARLSLFWRPPGSAVLQPRKGIGATGQVNKKKLIKGVRGLLVMWPIKLQTVGEESVESHVFW